MLLLDWLNNITSYLSWIPYIGGAGFAGAAVLLILAPSVIPLITNYLGALSPLIEGLAKGVVWFADTMWAGFKDMADNAKSIVFVVVVILLGVWYGVVNQTPCTTSVSCEKCIKDLRADYKFVPRTPTERREYLKNHPEVNQGWWDFLKEYFK